MTADDIADVCRALPDIVAVGDKDGRVMYLNDAARRFARIDADHERDVDMSHLCGPGSANVLLGEIVPEVVRRGWWSGEFVVHGADGVVRPVLATVVRIDHADAPRFMAIFRDFTQEREAMDALALFRALVDQSRDVVYVLDPETGLILDVSRSVRDLTGEDPTEIIGRTVFGYSERHVDVASWRAHLGRLREEGPQRSIGGVRHRNGARIPTETQTSLVAIHGKEYVIGTTRDHRPIVERTRELERFRALIDQSPDSIFLIDHATGQVLDANWAACRNLGFSASELKALRVGDFSTRLADPDVFQAAYAELRQNGHLRIRTEHRRGDGTTFPVEVNAGYLEVEGQGIVAAVARDLTDQVALEQELRTAVEAAQTSQLTKSLALRRVAHDLMQPLSTLVLQIDLLGMRLQGDKKGAHHVEMAKRALLQLDRLVNDFHDVAKAEAGDMRIQPAPIRLDQTVHEVAEPFTPRAEQLGLDLRLEIQDQVTVRADPGRIQQVVSNLLMNAFKFTPAGGTVTVSVASDGDVARVEVRDTGRGIPPQRLKDVFGPFVQVEEADATQLGGSGLGLAICRGIVQAHGGTIWAESAGEGQGTSVAFTLPLEK